MMAGRITYHVGWVDSTIHDFLLGLGAVPSDMKYVLITRLDSNPDVVSLFGTSRHLGPLKGWYTAVGPGALLSTRRLLTAERRDRALFGFDEVWFFPRRDVTPKPPGLVIRGTDPDHDSREVGEYSGWPSSQKCSLGLADGVGMNYYLRARGAAGPLLQVINEFSPHPHGGAREFA